MKSKEFILYRLNGIVEQFHGITFKYKFDEKELTHIIQVEPLEEFSNNSYMETESDLVFDFNNQYPDETILFVSSESIITVENPDEVIKFKILFDYSVDNMAFNYESLLKAIYEDHYYALAA